VDKRRLRFRYQDEGGRGRPEQERTGEQNRTEENRREEKGEGEDDQRNATAITFHQSSSVLIIAVMNKQLS